MKTSFMIIFSVIRQSTLLKCTAAGGTDQGADARWKSHAPLSNIGI